jgi:Tfp pilus assembly protein PilW
MAFAGPDAFTGANGTVLETYSANWTKVTGGSGTNMVINTNHIQVQVADDFQAHLWNAAQPVGADYDVQGTMHVASGGTSHGPAGRIASSSDGSCYFVRVSAGTWTLYKKSGAVTSIGTYVGDEPTTAKVCLLRMVGSTISVLIDTVSRISVTDTSITAKGYAGLATYYGAALDAEPYLDDWSATDASGAGVPFGLAKTEQMQALMAM